MIEFRQGNLFKSKADVLVNAVNCVGVMGAGIALQFKLAFPSMFKAYQRACKSSSILPGSVWVWDRPPVLCVATKHHWRGVSRIEWIVSGIKEIVNVMEQHPLWNSIAVPLLGCGYGGLDWAVVKPHMVDLLSGIDAEVWIYTGRKSWPKSS